MMEAEQDYVYTDSIKDLQKRLETMFNNPVYADTVFTVKKNKFHVLSQMIAVASGKLDAVMSEHFSYCNDRDMKLYDVKCEESFTVILKYVYGLDINFSQLKIDVLCEAINLAEVYQLVKFSNDLKQFVSKVDKFQLDSLAVLLNTSRKYNLNELYEKLKVFALEHAADFVKHESIVNLQYEVLLNLVKSDWFCAPEIDILMGVLNWHHRMSIKDAKETLDNNVQNEDINDDASSVASDHSATNTVLQSNDKGNTGEDNQDVDHMGVTVEAEFHAESADDDNTNSGAVMSNPDSLSVLVKSFTENVLRSLLLHIRVKHITMFDHITLSQTNLFEKYKHILGVHGHFSQTSELRQKYRTVVHESELQVPSHVPGNIISEAGTASVVAPEAPGPSGLHGNEPLAAINTPLPVDELSRNPDNEEIFAIAQDNNLFELRNIRKSIEIDPKYLFQSGYSPDDSFVIGDLKWIVGIANAGIHSHTQHFKRMVVYLGHEPHTRVGDYDFSGLCELRFVLPVGSKYSARYSSIIRGSSAKCQIGEFHWDLTHEVSRQLMVESKIEIHFKKLTIKWE